MSADAMQKLLRYRWLIFWILAFGYVMVYFHRLCPAVVAEDMRRDLSAGGGGCWDYWGQLISIPMP